ncbi:heme exporter protein CcmB [Pseudomonas paralactis]|uniref:ABC transporter permease subunit n=1 Tax=Pseudomonas TaxID=286 RepID=UPI001644660D|nr:MULTISPECIES: ABC transporter permease subunit [Pseudomonas]MBC3256677.1 heme exporter protein CcmB [Pseudomonas paralactis]WPN51968.1 heme exporter protein CcmB [Pseudomonas sp. P9_2]
MRTFWPVFKRELCSYFVTPVAYVFTLLLLLLSGISTFYLGDFYQRNQADLAPFFDYLPWLYALLLPTLAMRMWSIERQSGSIELLMCLAVGTAEAVLAKFLAAWVVSGLALALTFPLVITVNYLGAPDNGVILCGYLASWLLAGSCLAIGGCLSALTKNPLIAFLAAMALCLAFMACGFPVVLDVLRGWSSLPWLDGVASLSFLTHFEGLCRGVIDPQDVLYFFSQIIGWLAATVIAVELKKAV